MITIHLMGGLGNQLFQIYAVIAYSIRTQTPFILPYSMVLGDGIPRPTYWHSFLQALLGHTTYFSTPEFKQEMTKWLQYREPFFHYLSLPTVVRHDFSLMGYFQSWRYFADEDATIRQMMDLEGMRTATVAAHSADYFDTPRTCVAMHFRLGDYKHKQEYHPVMPATYYQRAMQELMGGAGLKDRQIRVVYSCETEDRAWVEANRVGPLQALYPDMEFVALADSLQDWEQLLLMSHCRHFIIANSSFSWWAAWWGTASNKRVFYPSVWFGPAMGPTQTHDLCPTEWVKIQLV